MLFVFKFQVQKFGRDKIGPDQLDELVSLSSELSSVADPSKSDNLFERVKSPAAFPPPDIPASVFDKDHAAVAIDKAEQIVTIANSIVN